MSNNTNNPIYTKLQPEDIDFFERVNDNITSGNALPFNIPVDSFFRIVIRSMKWFWEWNEYAVQEKTLFIPSSDIPTQFGGNIELLFPEGIEGIFGVDVTGSASGIRLADYMRIPLLNSFGSSTGYNSASSGYGRSNVSVSDSVIAMYEFSTYQELMKRGVRFSYNKNTRIFRVMSSVSGSLVVQAMVRLTPQELYNDQLFEDYVTARVEEQLGKIVTTFNFELPGGVQLNYDQIKENGRDAREKIEEQIKNAQNTDFIL